MIDFDQTMQLGPYPTDRRQARVLSTADATVHLLLEEGHLNVSTFMSSSEAGELAEMLMAAARPAGEKQLLEDLIGAAETVCANAEYHEEQWKASDYELYEPLREAIEAAKSPEERRAA